MRPVPKIPGYESLQFLGGSPLTSVYSGQDCATGKPRVEKVLRDDWADPSPASNSFNARPVLV